MKIVRYDFNNHINYGILENEVINELQGNIIDKYKITGKKIEIKDAAILNPIDPPNIIAVGLNYKRHAAEADMGNYPESPILFLKATTAVIGPEDDIILPKTAPEEVDYEAELAVIIGKKAKDISPDESNKYILGYTCANDITARDCQQRLDRQWARAKSFDTFCPLGPYIQTELDPDNCQIKSYLNGKKMQDSSTANLIFNVHYLISYCSRNMTLLPGTVILTGTPEGVGFVRNPPIYLQTGDKIEVEIEGIGKLTNYVDHDFE